MRDVIVTPDGIFATRCSCGMHPFKGHPARPIAPAVASAASVFPTPHRVEDEAVDGAAGAVAGEVGGPGRSTNDDRPGGEPGSVKERGALSTAERG